MSHTRTCIAVFLLLTMPGCLEIKVATTVHDDGSCERTVTANPSARELPPAAFPLPSDSSWSASWTPMQDSGKYLYRATKRFEDGGALSREYAARPGDSLKLRIIPGIETRFRWFFTYVSYRETYHQFNPFSRISPAAFFTENEVERISSGEESDTLKKRVDEWIGRNLFEGYHAALLDGARTLGDPVLTPAVVSGRKEELFQAMMNDTAGTADFASSMKTLGRFFGTRAVDALRPQLKSAWDDAEARLSRAQSADAEYSNAVTMPGLLLETNAGEVKGSTASWKFTARQFLLRDYDMRAESRVMNVWAVVLSGIIAVGLVCAVVLPGVRRRWR